MYFLVVVQFSKTDPLPSREGRFAIIALTFAFVNTFFQFFSTFFEKFSKRSSVPSLPLCLAFRGTLCTRADFCRNYAAFSLVLSSPLEATCALYHLYPRLSRGFSIFFPLFSNCPLICTLYQIKSAVLCILTTKGGFCQSLPFSLFKTVIYGVRFTFMQMQAWLRI